MKLTHCQRYGHVWRYETQCGQRFRVCVECGIIQYLFGEDGRWEE